MGRAIFVDWEPRDVAELVRLMSKFAEAIGFVTGRSAAK
jgi:hypothetical protein